MQRDAETDNKLLTLKTQLEAWRLQQTSRCPIPQQFWDKAFELLNSYSVGVLSRELQLDYKKLQKHLRSSHNVADKNSAAPKFLELAARELVHTTSPTTRRSDPTILPQAAESCRILIERADGNRLTLDLPADWLKIEAICNNFLRG
jgi:hypothetical protein